jgi:YHS domain-containing protein
MKKLLTTASVCMLALVTLSVYAAEEKKEAKKEGPVCPVSGKPCLKEHSVAYREAEVYFCCPNCPKAFEANTEKFATKANLQLVQTKQAKQTKCPLTGRDMADDKTVAVKGVNINVCCPNCLAKVTKAEGDEQLALLFSDKAFDKGFKVAKKSK